MIKSQETGNCLIPKKLHLDCGKYKPKLKSRLSDGEFLKFKQQNGKRTENKAKLKISFTSVYNSVLLE